MKAVFLLFCIVSCMELCVSKTTAEISFPLVTNFDQFSERKQVPPEIEECLQENGLDKEFMAELAKDKSRIDETKCFGYCLMDKLNLLDDSKVLKRKEFVEKLMSVMSTKDVEDIYEKCPDQLQAKMDCDSAKALHKCIWMI